MDKIRRIKNTESYQIQSDTWLIQFKTEKNSN